jgi:hypothetical protein
MFINVKPIVLVAILVLIAVGISVVALNVWARRSGYNVPGKAAVRCTQGHLFRMTWIEGGSLTMIKLGPVLRYGRCPVGSHWSTIRLVKEADLSQSERRMLDEEASA